MNNANDGCLAGMFEITFKLLARGSMSFLVSWIMAWSTITWILIAHIAVPLAVVTLINHFSADVPSAIPPRAGLTIHHGQLETVTFDENHEHPLQFTLINDDSTLPYRWVGDDDLLLYDVFMGTVESSNGDFGTTITAYTIYAPADVPYLEVWELRTSEQVTVNTSYEAVVAGIDIESESSISTPIVLLGWLSVFLTPLSLIALLIHAVKSIEATHSTTF